MATHLRSPSSAAPTNCAIIITPIPGKLSACTQKAPAGKETTIPIQAAYERAIKMRLAFEKAERARRHKEKRAER